MKKFERASCPHGCADFKLTEIKDIHGDIIKILICTECGSIFTRDL